MINAELLIVKTERVWRHERATKIQNCLDRNDIPFLFHSDDPCAIDPEKTQFLCKMLAEATDEEWGVYLGGGCSSVTVNGVEKFLRICISKALVSDGNITTFFSENQNNTMTEYSCDESHRCEVKRELNVRILSQPNWIVIVPT